MYRLVQFGQTSLEYYNQVFDVGSGKTPSHFQPLPDGGALDGYSGQRKHPQAVEITKTVRLYAATESAMSDLFFSIRALVGTRDKLYRQLIDDTLQWQYARLVEMPAVRDYQKSKLGLIQDIDLLFVTQDALWKSEHPHGDWYLDDGHYLDDGLYLDTDIIYILDSSPKVINRSVGSASDAGRAPVRDLQIKVMAGSSAITALTIARTDGETLTFSGTIASGEELIIDCGTMRVTNDGVDAYDDLSIAATADMAAWFTLQPGANNEITVTFTGGSTDSTLEFVYHGAFY